MENDKDPNKESARKFVSLLVHQLRSPITAIKWCAETLSRATTGPLNEKQAEYLEEIKKLNEKMARLVNDISTISKIENKILDIDMVPVSIPETIDSILIELEKSAQQKNVRFTVKSPSSLPLINFDQKLFGALVKGLVKNQIDYSPQNSEVIITTEQNTDGILLSFVNRGIGIKEEDFEKVFEKFYRGEEATKLNPYGNGLDLNQAKAIIDLVGGKIWFDSRENENTTFFVSIPLRGMGERSGTSNLSDFTQ